jgi:hypothetical protein
MMDILTIMAVGVLNILCFYFGSLVGQKAVKGEKIELPNPIQAIKENVRQREEEKEAEIERQKMEKILRNIENYDGTFAGQEDV